MPGPWRGRTNNLFGGAVRCALPPKSRPTRIPVSVAGSGGSAGVRDRWGSVGWTQQGTRMLTQLIHLFDGAKPCMVLVHQQDVGRVDHFARTSIELHVSWDLGVCKSSDVITNVFYFHLLLFPAKLGNPLNYLPNFKKWRREGKKSSLSALARWGHWLLFMLPTVVTMLRFMNCAVVSLVLSFYVVDFTIHYESRFKMFKMSLLINKH